MQSRPDSGGSTPSTLALLGAALKDPAWRARGLGAAKARLGSWLTGLAIVGALGLGVATLYGLGRHVVPWVGGHALRVACVPLFCEDRDWREVDLSSPSAPNNWRHALLAVTGQDPANSRSDSDLAERWREGASAGALYARAATLDEFKRQAGSWLDARAVESSASRQADDLRLATDWMRELARHGDPARAAKTAVEREGPRASDLAGDERFAQARAAEASVRAALAGLAGARAFKVTHARVAELSAPWRAVIAPKDGKERAEREALGDDLFGARLVLGIPTLALALLLVARLVGWATAARDGIEKSRQELSVVWERQQMHGAAEPPKSRTRNKRL